MNRVELEALRSEAKQEGVLDDPEVKAFLEQLEKQMENTIDEDPFAVPPPETADMVDTPTVVRLPSESVLPRPMSPAWTRSPLPRIGYPRKGTNMSDDEELDRIIQTEPTILPARESRNRRGCLLAMLMSLAGRLFGFLMRGLLFVCFVVLGIGLGTGVFVRWPEFVSGECSIGIIHLCTQETNQVEQPAKPPVAQPTLVLPQLAAATPVPVLPTSTPTAIPTATIIPSATSTVAPTLNAICVEAPEVCD